MQPIITDRLVLSHVKINFLIFMHIKYLYIIVIKVKTMVVDMGISVTPNIHKVLPRDLRDPSTEGAVEQRTDTLSRSISQASGETVYYSAIDDGTIVDSSARSSPRTLPRSVSDTDLARSSQISRRVSTGSVASSRSSGSGAAIIIARIVLWPVIFLFHLYQFFSDALEDMANFFRKRPQNHQ